ncbi:MAG: hypothetical protein HYY35_01760 [Deltaproteobacteria bacterium]|nr:hypothetical protein [Deltaproteobacteria bacterium]
MTESRRDPTEEIAGPVFQPDMVLPAQFFAALREKGFVEGEKRLMAAVLTDAVDCYMKQAFSSDGRGRQLFQDAEAWLFETESSRWFFSFVNICDVLGLDPEYLRRGLKEWRLRRVPTLRSAEAFRREPRSSHDATTHRELKKAVG